MIQVNRQILRRCLLGIGLLFLCQAGTAKEVEVPEILFPPYEEQKVVYEFFFDHPVKIYGALDWMRTHFLTLDGEPYDIPPDFIDMKVVLHGTEVVTLAKKNYERYSQVVQRMSYYAELGVEFRVCANTLKEFDYQPSDMQEFIRIIPSAVTDLTHLQNKGYALIIPRVHDKNYTNEELR